MVNEMIAQLKAELARKENLIMHQQELIKDLNRRLASYEDPPRDDELIAALRERIDHFKARAEKRDAQNLELAKCFYKNLDERATFRDAVDLLQDDGDIELIDTERFAEEIILELGEIITVAELEKIFIKK